MKKLITALFLVMVFSTLAHAGQVSQAYDPSDLFTGDTRLACEAILCLSSPSRPSECDPALRRLFSIKKYKDGIFNPSRTMRAREQFLQLCPSGGDQNLSSLATAISRTMNQCDAGSLNKRKVYYAREYDVLNGIWSAWRLVGRDNDDQGKRSFSLRNKFDASSFPPCSQQQLDYKANLAKGGFGRGGRNSLSMYDTDSVEPICYQTKSEIDPTPPTDCMNLFNSNYSYYDDLKYVNGKWVDN